MSETTTPTPSAQEIFEKTARHLFAQGKRSVGPTIHGETLICRYRTDDGLACAVGCHIPSDVYVPEMEGINVHHLIHDFRGKVDFLKPHPSLLEQLQSIHDAERHWMRSANMRNALQGVASAFNLDGTFLAGLSFADR